MASVNIKTTGLPYAKQLQEFGRFKAAYPRFVGNIAVNFYKDSFRRSGFINKSGVEKWDARKPNTWSKKSDKGRKLLIKTGRLRRSIRIIRTGVGYVQVGSDVPYARIHNEGGNISTVQNISSYVRKGYKRKSHTRTWNGKQQKIKASVVSSASIKAHKRKVNITMPKRQYMGMSLFLLKRIVMNTENKIKQILNTK
jgi:phage gpG-like protein